MNDYESKKQARIKKYKAKSEKLKNESDNIYKDAEKMAIIIPFGQPILVGHHSEKGDRNYRNKINNKFEKSFKLSNEAKHYEQKAIAAENNNSISSDDPEVIKKLKVKIESLEKNQELMKIANKILRGKGEDENKIAELKELGLSEKIIKEILTPYMGIKGYQGFTLSNNNVNIRRFKKRLEFFEKQRNQETKEICINEIKIIDNVEANRLQIFFPGKPDEEIRKKLKSNGFRWSPRNNCWQSYRGDRYLISMHKLILNYYGEKHVYHINKNKDDN